MRILRCASKEQLAYDAAVAGADRIRAALHKRGRATIVLATGMSQAGMLEYLVREPLDWGRVTAFHLDEYVGMGADHPASFRKYLKERFLDHVTPKAFIAIEGERNPVTECQRLNKLLGGRTVDVAFVGIGENGHLAFNDPPADFRTVSPYIIVKLDKACRRQQVKEGWFGTLLQVPTKAISMSIRQILKAETIICSVPDRRKAKAAKAALEGRVTSKVPASALQQHPRAHVYLDPESASLLGPARGPVVIDVPRLEDCPPLRASSKHFHLLVAGDFTRMAPAAQIRLVRRALDSGAATVTAWGKGSSGFEMEVDSECVARGIRKGREYSAGNVIRTASHKPEALEEALFYFLDTCSPAPAYQKTCTSWVAVVVGDFPHRQRVLDALHDPGAFIDAYVNA